MNYFYFPTVVTKSGILPLNNASKVEQKVENSGSSRKLIFTLFLFQIGLGEQANEACDMIKRMYDLFQKKDALLIEVNPYAEDAVTGQCESV